MEELIVYEGGQMHKQMIKRDPRQMYCIWNLESKILSGTGRL